MAGDRVRDEAERLVAAAIAAVSLAARGVGAAGRGATIANGSPECCVCPVCRVISAMRDPSSDLAERLASGAGDLATGVASMLRALSRTTGQSGHDEPPREGDEFWEELRRRATAEARASATEHSGPSTFDGSTFGGAGRGSPVGGADRGSTQDDPWHVATTAPSPPAKKMAKKAVAKKSVAPPAETPPPARKATPAKKVAKKTVPVKKVAKKAPPSPPEDAG